MSRRRFIRRVVGGVVLGVVVVVGCAPTLRYMGYLSRHGKREVAQTWQVVRLSADRRWVQIRVDECGAAYDGARVAKVGHNVRLTVYVRDNDDRGEPSCVPFERMPTHVVMLGFTLPKGGRVLQAS